MASPNSRGRPARSPFQNGILPGSPGAGETSTRSWVISWILQEDAPRTKVSPGAALEDHLLVELADARGAGAGADQEDAEQTPIGNGAAVDDGHALGTLASGNRAGEPVPGDSRPQFGKLVGRIASRQHIEHALIDAATELRERRGAPDRGKQLVGVPRVHRRHRDDLLRGDVERIAWITRGLDLAVVHRPRDGRAGDQIAAEFREDHAFADRVHLVAAATDALQTARHRRRRLDLHDEIDGAHVDAELERRGRHERAKRTGLQEILHLGALLPCDRAMVRPDQRLARQFVEGTRQPLGQTTAVDEDQR